MTSIEWTQETWNPIVGCSIVSPGCTNCYAMRMAARIEAMNAEARAGEWADAKKRAIAAQYDGTTQKVNGNAVWTGHLAMAGDKALLAPLKRKKPTTYFVNSMGDLFHEAVPDDWIDKVFAVMALTPQHTYQVLTKRSQRMREYFTKRQFRDAHPLEVRMDAISAQMDAIAPAFGLTERVGPFSDNGLPLPNVWLGVSTERQQEADERIPDLLATPAAIRFISAEPLLGPIDLSALPFPKSCACEYHAPKLDALSASVFCEGCCEGPERMDIPRLDWVIVGGESSPDARPMHPEWARALRDQCNAAGVPFFFKQWGEYLPALQCLPGYGKIHGATAIRPGRMKLHYGGSPQEAPKHAFAQHGVEFASIDNLLTFRVGKSAAGRVLDGLIHDEYPEAAR
jgi:protein gp37